MDEPLVWAFLRKAEAHGLPNPPEVMLEGDEHLGFDWFGDAGQIISVSLSPIGLVSWAALVDDYKAHGRFQWPDWSPELDQAFMEFKCAQQEQKSVG